MAPFVHVMFVMMLGMFSMVNCRFILYDSGDSSTKVDIGAQFADVKKTLSNILSKVDAPAGDTPTSNTTSELPRDMVCPDGWLRFKGSCYFFDSNSLDFQSAEKKCKNLNAYTVRLETPEENQFLKDFIVNHFKMDLGTYHWIGMTDMEKEGLWKIYGTNEMVPFTDWEGSEPQNAGGIEHCAIIHKAQWADVSCSSKFRALCEKNGGVL